MSKENEDNNQTVQVQNLFEKFYFQKIDESKKLLNNSKTKIPQALTSSQISSNTNDINVESSNYFAKCFINSVIPYLSIKDVINLKKCSKLLNIIINPKSLKICILSNSTNNFTSKENRISIWQHYMSFKNFTSEIFDKYLPEKEESQKNNEEKYYKYLSQIINKIKNNEELIENEKGIYNEEKIKKIKNSIDFIKRDIDRTYYTDFFIKEGGKEMLKNVLEFMCGVPGNVGYCQGMNFIVGAMLSLFRREETALYIFSNLIQKYELTNLFAYNTPDYGIRVFQLNYYVRKYIPSIYHHFKNNNLSFDMIYSRWLLTLFANYLEINRLDFPWSCIFCDGWKGIIKICLILLYELKEQLLKCDLEKLSNLLKEETLKYHNNYMNSFFLYQKFFKVKNKKLKELRNEYFIDLARKKLEETNSQVDQWAEDQKQPLNEYLEKKNNLELESQKKIEEFKILNEEANKKYLIAFRQYSDYMKSVNLFKQNFDKIATKKFEYDRIISHYTNIINEIDNPKDEEEKEKEKEEIKNENEKEPQNNKETQKEKKKKEKEEKAKLKKHMKEIKAKKNMLIKERNKILEKYGPIKKEFEVQNEILFKKCDVIDKYKTEFDKWLNEKNKTKDEMEKYLFQIEEKNKEFIQVLSDKLKLSENYKKSYKF